MPPLKCHLVSRWNSKHFLLVVLNALKFPAISRVMISYPNWSNKTCSLTDRPPCLLPWCLFLCHNFWWSKSSKAELVVSSSSSAVSVLWLPTWSSNPTMMTSSSYAAPPCLILLQKSTNASAFLPLWLPSSASRIDLTLISASPITSLS